jgi:hypothetical protein
MALVSEQIRNAAVEVADSLAVFESSVQAASLPALIDRFDDAGVEGLLRSAAALRAQADAVLSAGAGVVAKRSRRELGFDGLAARGGHRSAEGLLQSITGSSRGEAARQVRVGEAMGEADAATRLAERPDAQTGDQTGSVTGSVTGEDEQAAASEVPPVAPPWYEPITRAVTDGVLTAEGAAAVLRGMGEPSEHCAAEVMRSAAIDLLADVAQRAADDPNTTAVVNADELVRLARQARDRIDPVGVAERFQRRYQDRSCRMGRNAAGARTAWVVFDDESAAWVDSIVDAGMRPRRGGPRFVDKAEAERAQRLRDDPRSNDQLVFDLLMDTIKAGTLAEPAIAFGSRQPGVRIITTKEQLDKTDADGHRAGIGFVEDTGQTLPAEVIESMICESGTRQIVVDEAGNPLDVGREQRLFTVKQKIALAYRDGGCMDPDCDRPASYTEAHHIDEWAAHHGKTNIADGILFCHFHHMLIHHEHWRVQRKNSVYWLVPPPGDTRKPIRLHSKATWKHQQAS